MYLCVSVCVCRWGWRHKIYTGPIVYSWAPEGTVHLNVHMADRDVSLTRRKMLEYTARSRSASIYLAKAMDVTLKFKCLHILKFTIRLARWNLHLLMLTAPAFMSLEGPNTISGCRVRGCCISLRKNYQLRLGPPACSNTAG